MADVITNNGANSHVDVDVNSILSTSLENRSDLVDQLISSKDKLSEANVKLAKFEAETPKNSIKIISVSPFGRSEDIVDINSQAVKDLVTKASKKQISEVEADLEKAREELREAKLENHRLIDERAELKSLNTHLRKNSEIALTEAERKFDARVKVITREEAERSEGRLESMRIEYKEKFEKANTTVEELKVIAESALNKARSLERMYRYTSVKRWFTKRSSAIEELIVSMRNKIASLNFSNTRYFYV